MDHGPWHRVRRLPLLAGFFLCYFTLAAISIWIAKLSGLVAVAWLANGPAFAFVLRHERRIWPVFATALVLANGLAAWVHSYPPFLGMTIGLGNATEILVAAAVAEWFHSRTEQDLTLEHACLLLGTLLFIGIPLGGLVGSPVIAHALHIPWRAAYPNWLLGHSVGVVLTVVPAVLISQGQAAALLSPSRIPQWLIGLGASLSATYVVLTFLPFRFIYAAVPLLIIAVRLGTLAASLICTTLLVFFGELMLLGLIPLPESILEGGPRSLWPAVALTALLPQLAGLIWDSKERQREALAASERQFRSAMELAATGFALTDPDGRFREVNSTLCLILGYTREALLALHHQDIVFEADRERVLLTRRMLVAGELDRYAMEKRYVRPDGGIVWVLGKGTCIRGADGRVGVMLEVEDITRRRAHEREIAALSERLRLATEAFHMGTWDLDLRDHNLDWDAQMYTLYDAKPDTGISTYALWRSRVHPDDLAEVEAALRQSSESGAAFQCEYRIVLSDGQVRHISAGGLIKCDADGTPSHLIGMNWDITSRKQTELALAKARDAAEAAARTKGEFLANMSHEIRTPMNAVLGMAHLLAGTALNPEQQQYLSMIERSGKSLLGILNDVLDISKIDAGRLELTAAEFNLDEVMSVLVSVMSVNAGEKDLELAIGVEPDVPRALIGDSLRLQQILINLTGNAIKFTDQGEVALLASMTAQEPGRARLKFVIRDTGIGMTEPQLQRLFQAFSQGDMSTTRRYGGTGLGLNICKRFVDLMGGTMGVESTPGVGSLFWVEIPFALPDRPAPLNANRPDHELRLLVIDDNRTALDYLAKIITGWRWRADLVSSCDEALLKLHAAQQDGTVYDAALVDWRMPVDGWATLRAIRSTLGNAQFPVLMMVGAFARERVANDDAAAEITGIITKPVTSSSLSDALQQLIPGQSPTAQAVRPNFANRFAGYHVLLVEDTRVNQLVAIGMLEQLGASCEIAPNGQVAVEMVKANAARFDLVLMDIQMPVMDGIAATHYLRHQLDLAVPIIAMSAGVMQAERELCIDAGMDDFVAKPIEAERLAGVMAKFLPTRTKFRHPRITTGHASFDAVMARVTDTALFHPDALLEEVMMDRAVQRQIIAEFAKEASRFAADVRHALGRLALDEAKRLFHTLKGTAGTVAARQVAELASKGETAARAGNTAEALRVLGKLEPVLDALLGEIDTWLEETAGKLPAPPVQRAAQPDTPPDGETLLQSLHDLLAQNNIRACKVWASLKPEVTGRLGDATASALDHAIAELRFDEACALLEPHFLNQGTPAIDS